MRVSYEWLLDYIDPKISAVELAELLTLSGIEVGAVEQFGPALPGVVVGQVLALEPHPGKNNLTLVETDTGEQVLSIVCGASNMKVGDKVVTAKPGSELPGPRYIQETKIYGVPSAGMLCSARELGLDLGTEDEILILDGSAGIGRPAAEILGFDDHILHLELTPNRADCLGMLGVAHEVAALTGGQVKMPPLEPEEIDQAVHEAVKISVEDGELCPRYTARAVKDLVIGRSPLWLQLRLLKAGIRPISNVVDITNYVMWEFGQPLHAFDLQLLKKNEITVRRARQGETLVTLDGMERKLDPENLVIVDGEAPVGLAGVMGGEETEVTASTRDVLIEAANFNPTSIRLTARRFNLPSEASQRFEKGVNPEAATWAQDRTALLLGKLAGGKTLQGIIDINNLSLKPKQVRVSPARINKILGLPIPEDETRAILNRLGFHIEDMEDGNLAVTVPLRRADINLEEDIVEEVARLHGYDKIPVTLPHGELHENRESEAERLKSLVRNILIAGGYYECITYSFINPQNLLQLRLPDDDYRRRAVPVRNPFSEEQAVMRTTQLPGLLKVMQHNFSHRELNQRLFEIGSVYEPESLPLTVLPREKVKLTLAVTGLIPEPNWLVPAREADFFALKGVLETLFNRLQIYDTCYIPQALPFSHPTRCAIISACGEEVGFLGQLHPEVAGEWEIDQQVAVCELDMEVLGKMANLVPRVVALPRYPAAKRDLAVVVSRDISALRLEQAIRKAGGGLVSSVRLFDLYEGRQIPEGKRSLAYSITFRRDEGTLTDSEVNRAQKNIEQALFDLGAVLRS